MKNGKAIAAAVKADLGTTGIGNWRRLAGDRSKWGQSCRAVALWKKNMVSPEYENRWTLNLLDWRPRTHERSLGMPQTWCTNLEIASYLQTAQNRHKGVSILGEG